MWKRLKMQQFTILGEWDQAEVKQSMYLPGADQVIKTNFK